MLKLKKRRSFRLNHWFLAVVLWVGIVFGGFYLAKQYFDHAIQAVQQTNAVHVQTLEARLENLTLEVSEIQKGMKTAGRTLSSSDSTQKELNKKIEDLDRQLKDLEKSLSVLREAPNAAR